MTDEQIKSVALYFYFALPGEVLALEATDYALKKLKKDLKQEQAKIYPLACIVKTCSSVHLKFLKNLSKKKISENSLSKKYSNLKRPWKISSNVQLGPWKQYLTEKTSESVNIAIWVHILKIDAEEVARGLNITLGTLNYRLGEALKTLGHTLVPGSKASSGDLTQKVDK